MCCSGDIRNFWDRMSDIYVDLLLFIIKAAAAAVIRGSCRIVGPFWDP